MRLVADESVDRQIVEALRRAGHEVVFITELAPGINDDEVLALARSERSLLLTADKDFGELVFRLRRVSHGVLLLRLAGEKPAAKAARTCSAVESHEAELGTVFSVLTSRNLRIRRVSEPF